MLLHRVARITAHQDGLTRCNGGNGTRYCTPSQPGTYRPGTGQFAGARGQNEGTFCLVRLEPELF
jgi:hypothetical protein